MTHSAQAGPSVALITGAARRIGAQIARTLHAHDYHVIIHHHQATAEAEALCAELNDLRADSALALRADLSDMKAVTRLAAYACAWQQGVDLLVNNASAFYPRPLAETRQEDWDTLFASNARAPYFLSQQLLGTLKEREGAIVNLIDAMVERPSPGFSLYTMAKSALRGMTLSLARELAPAVRVNAVSPGAILWPEHEEENGEQQAAILAQIPLQRQGEPGDIARAVLFLAREKYITGQIIAVDGGRSL